ncbi:MAG: hypothetical protein LC107_13430 [Chitinophagales bacterium]|nr:hypothetical protein [Chitinophagales bacterium]
MIRLFLISVLYIFFTSSVHAQISLCPEVGINYRPYVLESLTDEFHNKTPEWYVNLGGEVNLSSGLVLSSQIGYVFRKNTIVKLCGITGCDNANFINRDMNFSVNFMYSVLKNVRIGLGGGIFYKLNAHLDEEYRTRGYNITPTARFLYNGHFQMDYGYKKYRLIARYHYIFNTEDAETFFARLTGGNYAVSWGVGYQLFKRRSR